MSANLESWRTSDSNRRSSSLRYLYKLFLKMLKLHFIKKLSKFDFCELAGGINSRTMSAENRVHLHTDTKFIFLR